MMSRTVSTSAVLAIVGLAGLLAACAPAPSPAAFPLQIDVYVAGEDAYDAYRIPAVVQAPNGTLLAFAEGRRTGAGDTGDIDLVLKRSLDGGLSWSALEVVGDNGPNTFGNPCPVVDAATGTIWLFTTHNLGVDRESAIIDGTSQGSRTVWLMRSDDNGTTWSAPSEITGATKREGWTWYATGPGVGIQTRTGRLVIPANHAEARTAIHRSHILYSDDHGATWGIGAVADPGTNESQIAELSDGRLLLNMRNHPSKPENFRMVAVSSDNGATFSRAVPDPALIEPPAQASLLRWPVSDGGAGLAFSNPAAATRVRMTVRLSTDDGRSWPISRVVHEGPSAYSSQVAVSDDLLGVLYERGDRTPYERITFARLTREWLVTAR